ncbi:MAG: TrkH family potassium uptake protein [Clostridiales bacterium]|nr:TrkH family potassium uptake protein [Clostridiales bacterium]
MDFGIILKVLGLLLLIESAFMVPSLGISIYYGEYDTAAFIFSIAITAIAGLPGFIFFKSNKRESISHKEGFMIVGLGWIAASAFGALPFRFSGVCNSFVDAYFESTSGFTTTGASIFKEVENLPHGILLWRSFTHWLGGMGILVFTLALLPAMGASTIQIYRAESTGPSPDKLAPKIGQTAKLLYGVYVLVTVIMIATLLIAGMPLFDAITHTFGTVGTGGFSVRNSSIGSYQNPAYDWIIAFFMLFCAINFSLHYEALHGNFKALIKDSEFRFYAGIVLCSITLIAINIYPLFDYNVMESIRQSTFQVASVISTTGYATVDYNTWPDFSKMILFLLMLFGGCAGSTGGGIKHIRILVLFKIIRREFYKLIHPHAVITIRVGGKPVSEDLLQNIVSFVLLYLIILILVSLLLLTQGLDMMSSISATVAALSNIGPGFGLVGPASNYADLSGISKIILTACMLIGRLEIYTLTILFVPTFWRQ